MFARIKKFHQDHKDKIEIIAYSVTVGSICYIAGVLTTKHYDGLTDIRLFEDVKNDKMFLRVDRRDGSFQNYLWDPERKD